MKKTLLLLILFISASLLKAQDVNIIPKPTLLEHREGIFTLSDKTKIIYDKGLEKQAAYLQEMLSYPTGFPFQLSEKKKGTDNIQLVLDKAVKHIEGYTLAVTPKGVTIVGSTAAGVFYGIQSLLQTLPAQIYNRVRQPGVVWTSPSIYVEDAPSYMWRGVMFDVARYFYDAEYIKKYIDMMAMYKLNKFQFHLVDDSGWRLESKKYPLLTEVGAWGGKDENRIGGYYTQEEMKEIIEYAALRNVEVIPEIEFPAHMQSAVAAYPWLSCTEKEVEVPVQHFISRELLCMGKESSYKFLEDILTETVALFPSKYINIGGDEAVYTNWDNCEKCQALKKELGLEKSSELQGHLTNVVSDMMKKHGKTIVGWEEIVQRGDLNNQVVAVIWRNLKYTKDATERGHYAVLCPATHTYFDFPESKTPGEVKAATWMPPITVEKCYSMEVDKYNTNSLVLGVQACYWSDQFIHGTVLQEINLLNENRSEQYADYFTFPRLLALSEVGWTAEKDREYPEFAQRLKSHYEKLDNKDCNYRVPEPVMTIVENTNDVTFSLTPAVAGAKMVYTTDGSYPHTRSKEYTAPVTVDNKHDFKAITVVSNRHYSLPVYVKDELEKYKKYGAYVAKWSPSSIKGKEYAPLRLDATGKISGNGTYELTFIYTGGTYKLEIEGIKVYKRDELLAEVSQKGEAGGSSVNNVYTFTIDQFEAGTPFYIEAMVKGDLGNDSNGLIFIKKK